MAQFAHINIVKIHAVLAESEPVNYYIWHMAHNSISLHLHTLLGNYSTRVASRRFEEVSHGRCFKVIFAAHKVTVIQHVW